MIPGSNKDHPSFLKSFSYAMEGFVTAVKTERNIKVMLAAVMESTYTEAAAISFARFASG